MFALIAAADGGVAPPEIAAMAAALRGASKPASVFRDAGGRAGLIASTAGILPEDEFDSQPLVAADLAFVAQARLDNRADILARLGVARERWATLADSDILHLAYRRWDADCVQHLAGDYAFAAWHADSGRVVAATDHVGSVRLYYARCAGKLVVASQLGVVLANPSVARDLDRDALGLLVAPRLVNDATPFKAVRILPGGSLFVCEKGELRCRRWWRPDAEVGARRRDPRDYVEQARMLMDGAVKDCLRAEGEIAATMSGGLDSTLIAASAALQLGREGRTLLAYTAVPQAGLAYNNMPGWEADDSGYAAAVARLHGNIAPHVVSPGGLCTLDILPALHARSHTPVRNGANHIWLSRIHEAAAADGARVVLAGMKGNATVSQAGEGIFFHLLRRLQWRALLDLARRRAEAGGPPAWHSLAHDLAGRRGRALIARLRGRAVPERFGQDVLAPGFRAAHRAALRDEPITGTKRTAQVAFAVGPLKTWAADPLPQWNVEARDPLADRRLIECLLTFPLDAFVAGGRMRGLAREIGAGRLPDMVRLRETRGEQMPEAAALIAAHAQAYRKAYEQAASSALFRTIVDVDRLRGLLERLCRGDGSKLDAATVERALDVGLFMAAAGA
ncbi:MAG TPA: asparagine synthase-related protein [Rhizomicrobium sp.]|jgi:asparagine synthase (glutamine-hydrolysing)|nr:asparagine synthase-related protein [Rhizomicrobium sp.]